MAGSDGKDRRPAPFSGSADSVGGARTCSNVSQAARGLGASLAVGAAAVPAVPAPLRDGAGGRDPVADECAQPPPHDVIRTITVDPLRYLALTPRPA